LLSGDVSARDPPAPDFYAVPTLGDPFPLTPTLSMPVGTARRGYGGRDRGKRKGIQNLKPDQN